MSAPGVTPFEVTLGGLGAFPEYEYIEVVWVGTRSGGTELEGLHRLVEGGLAGLGFEPEDRPFTPHVTIARVDHTGGKERVQAFLRERDPTIGTMTVASISLMASELTAEGPTYSTVEAVSLQP